MILNGEHGNGMFQAPSVSTSAFQDVFWNSTSTADSLEKSHASTPLLVDEGDAEAFETQLGASVLINHGLNENAKFRYGHINSRRAKSSTQDGPVASSPDAIDPGFAAAQIHDNSPVMNHSRLVISLLKSLSEIAQRRFQTDQPSNVHRAAARAFYFATAGSDVWRNFSQATRDRLLGLWQIQIERACASDDARALLWNRVQPLNQV